MRKCLSYLGKTLTLFSYLDLRQFIETIAESGESIGNEKM